MNAYEPDHLAYADMLANYAPRIAMSLTCEEASLRAAEFLGAVDGLINTTAKEAVQSEVDYLWNVFPSRAKTIENYRNLIQVLLAQAVDSQWYCGYPVYSSDQAVEDDETLVSFRRGADDFEVNFIYVRYYDCLLYTSDAADE